MEHPEYFDPADPVIRTRPRRPLYIKLLTLAGLMLIIVFVAYLSGASHGRQEILSALPQQQEAEPQEPIPQKITPFITGDLVLQQLETLPKLVSVEYRYTNMGKFEDQTDFYGWAVPFTTKRFIVSYDGRIMAGLDELDKILAEVNEEARTVTITLPRSKILSHEIYEDSLEVFDETANIFNPIKIEDYAGFTKDQKGAVEQRAIAGGLLTSADEQAREAVRSLLALVPGMEEYTLTVR